MALQSREWTLAEFDRLADDGNKYELLDGALLVTPAPSPAHGEDMTTLAWHPVGAASPLVIDIPAFFASALGTHRA
ncbi:MAG: Uma2 family endonuclease [Gemmatimonadaceae bacterium]|nr:Uma2 family endonuclease [Gemmatimonadaceae bacterium]